MQSVDRSQHQRMSSLTKQQISQYMMSDLMVPKAVAMKTPGKKPAQKFINMVDYNRRDHHHQATEGKTSSIEKYQTMSLSGFKGSTLSRAKDHSPPGGGWTQTIHKHNASTTSMNKQSKTTFNPSETQPIKRFHFPPGHIPDYERLHNPQRFNRYCPCCIRKKDELEKSPHGKKSILSSQKEESPPPRMQETLNFDSDDNRKATPEPVV